MCNLPASQGFFTVEIARRCAAIATFHAAAFGSFTASSPERPSRFKHASPAFSTRRSATSARSASPAALSAKAC